MKNGLELQGDDLLWYRNDNLHKEDGPAIIRENGYRAWYVNGKCHRIDGPAKIYPSGNSYWYLDDYQYPKKDHPFNIFRNEYNLSENIEDWPKDKQMLFKLSYI